MALGAVTIVTANIAGTSGTYVTGDVIGSETSLTSAVSSSAGSGVIEKIIVYDDANALLAFDLWFSSAAGTPAVDSAAYAPSDANNRLYKAVVPFPAPIAMTNNKIVIWTGAENIRCAATTLFVIMIARATIGTIAASAIGLEVYIRQDQ